MRCTLKICFLLSMLIHGAAASEINDMMDRSFLMTIIKKLEQGENIIFTKCGDGEYNCMVGLYGANCDGDQYHAWLGRRLKESFVSLAKKPNTYLGQWWTEQVCDYCNRLADEHNIAIPWVNYHLVMNDNEFLNFDYMHQFVQFLVATNRKKILVCNKLNERLKELFRTDCFIEIPAQSWSFEYDYWKNVLEQVVEENAIILIAGGLCSKVLIDDITTAHAVTCIDLGSSFDQLARKKNTRGWSHDYRAELEYYKDLVPSEWRVDLKPAAVINPKPKNIDCKNSKKTFRRCHVCNKR